MVGSSPQAELPDWYRAADVVCLPSFSEGVPNVLREAVARKLAELEGELAGPEPSRVERLLAGRAALCWAQAHLADLDAIQKDRAGTPQAAHAQKRQNAAQARYLAAVRQLAAVRKLMKAAPSPLQLLKYPINESDGDVAGGRPRAASPQTAAAAN